MKKKLLAIFGPIIVALVALFICSSRFPVSEQKAQEAASSIDVQLLKGDAMRNQVLADKNYVPFFGSSEYTRFDPFHPSVLAAKYHRGYTPYLLGTRGTTPLVEYTFATSLGDDLNQRKAIFIISPQWFSKKGLKPSYAQYWISPVQVDSWLLQTSTKKISQPDQYYAKRLVQLDALPKNRAIAHLVTKVSEGKTLTASERFLVKVNHSLLTREERLFGAKDLDKNLQTIEKYERQLPDDYDYKQMYQLAGQIGQRATDNNDFKIKNAYYKKLEPKIKRMKGTQVKTNYTKSPDYSDMQLVLDQFKKEKTEVLFFITPVNSQWMKYTGLSEKMMKAMANKMEYQLKSQGFNHVVNMTDKNQVPYFTTDPIHLGWRGWLYMDQYIKPFLESPYKAPNYRMNPYFYSDDWQQRAAGTIPGYQNAVKEK